MKVANNYLLEENSVMHNLAANIPEAPKEGQLVEGTVSAIGRARVYVDLPPFGTGLLFGREYMNARDILRKVSVGDTIAAKVVDVTNEDGYIELSSRKLVRHSSGLTPKKQ